MKKTLPLLILGILLFQNTITFAGEEDDKKFYKGIRGGYQSSNFSNSDWDDLNSFYVGFFGAKRIGAGKLLSLYSGLEYSQSGSSKNEDNEIILGYISIPVNLRLKVGPVYAFGGFNPSFKVSEEVKIGGVDSKDIIDVNGFDIGAQIGLGVKFLFMGAEIKYNQGLTDVYTDNTSHSLQLGLCVYF